MAEIAEMYDDPDVTDEYKDYRRFCDELSKGSLFHSIGNSPVVFTAGVNAEIAEKVEMAKHVMKSLSRYGHGDWGDMAQEDLDMNDRALKNGDDRIMASYESEAGKIWIITEWDRSVTTILFPYEY